MGFMKVEKQVSYSIERVPFLNRGHRLEDLSGIYLNSKLQYIYHNIQIRHMFREGNVAVSEAQILKQSKRANKVTGLVRCIPMFVELMKTMPTFKVTFMKEDNKRFLKIRTVHAVTGKTGSHFLTGISGQSY